MTFKFSDDLLRLLVPQCTSFTEVHLRIGGSLKSSSAQTHTSRRIRLLGLSTAHFISRSWNKGIEMPPKFPIERYLQQKTLVSSSSLKKRLIREGVLENSCKHCGGGPRWRGSTLSLHLDHINTDHLDNRLENLQILCPNCHAVKTSKDRASRRKKLSRSKSTNLNWRRTPRPDRRKVLRPSLEQLEEDLCSLSYCAVGRKYGVTDNAIRKWLGWYKKENLKT